MVGGQELLDRKALSLDGDSAVGGDVPGLSRRGVSVSRLGSSSRREVGDGVGRGRHKVDVVAAGGEMGRGVVDERLISRSGRSKQGHFDHDRRVVQGGFEVKGVEKRDGSTC